MMTMMKMSKRMMMVAIDVKIVKVIVMMIIIMMF